MKTIKYLTLIAFLYAYTAFAQTTPWVQEGNGSTNQAIHFVGTLDDEDLRFRTNDTPRMCLTATTGLLGIGIDIPLMRLHIDGGGVLVTGTTGANPNLGAGNRMMYVAVSDVACC